MKNKIKVIILILIVAVVAVSCSFAGFTYIKTSRAQQFKMSKIF